MGLEGSGQEGNFEFFSRYRLILASSFRAFADLNVYLEVDDGRAHMSLEVLEQAIPTLAMLIYSARRNPTLSSTHPRPATK